MKIIVPMAGRGTRLRPHTLTTPKPLIKIVGKPIVQRLMEDITKICGEPVDEIAFIIGDFGAETEKDLIKVAESLGAKGSIYHQDKPLGTAHAILCAKESLQGKCVVAFADTLFRADFTLDQNKDGIIWTQKVADPSAFGVVKLDGNGNINEFVEKPKDFVSDLAIIGIYYFKDGENLRAELQYLLDNNIMQKGEYQLTDALENMKNKGLKFGSQAVAEWLDCGNKDATIDTNSRYLGFIKDTQLISASAKIENSTIIPPVFLGENAVIRNSVIGPYVSVGDGTLIEKSIISSSLIQENSRLENLNISNSMLGNHVTYTGRTQDLSAGDFTVVKQ